ncbi:RND transporter, hydrophobe/amphiphile efflux-1 family protein [Ochrobactrum quorumnocens]|uniref:Efflux pump membrane transporter n=1 Tax=Ochrobactrum quorumnocens TaxID=271865 RepID=A0A248UDZ1_9HYPH|nr:efflux RND transporter permease subunit [[Ochrobactrum] quorumnocens]ASV84832.1 RND transporter, hydrophobe/amphiphile efflux-1 family protein [[Ochrobactrum] quorumnocens]
MAQFFIGRPIFAWVVAIFIIIAGLLAIPSLPVAQYPNVAPPQISIFTTYPGASPEDIYQSVTAPIEQELNSVDGLIYFESTSDSSGTVQINVTFEPGTDTSQASIDVQNAVRRVESRLPEVVSRQGVQVQEAGTGFLMLVALVSTDGNTDVVGLGDYLNRNVLGEIQRIKGVGRAQVFASQRAMRIWIDPDKMVGLKLSTADINNAIAAQNAQVAAGRIGARPNPINQQISATVLVKGQLTTPEEFGSIVLRANSDGSSVRLRDVARIEVGGEAYSFSSQINGKPAAAIAVQLSPTGNAMETATAVKAKMEELSKYFPAGIEYLVPYDTSPFVKISIEKVMHTLIEAIVLVFIVMFIFLQNFRYTIIPTLVVPVALLGTCAIMFVSGFSINVLTMFAMVLAIGILVDDAIVVVENVERIMAEEGLSPKEATRKAMSQISGAIIGITIVLTAVFIPMAFFPGAVGVIYQQFSLTMVVSILFSGFLALSLTPALCATFLKPIPQGHHEKKGFFGWFNRKFDAGTRRYSNSVSWIVQRTGRFMIIYVVIVGGLAYLFLQLPSSFLPNEDQGFVLVDIQTPPEASTNRTDNVAAAIDKVFAAEPSVEDRTIIHGYSFSGFGDNAAIAFVTLKDWSERDANNSAAMISQRGNGSMAQLQDAVAFALSPPPIQGLGNSGGFTFRLQDRSGAGQNALNSAANQLMAEAQKSNVLSGVRTEGMPAAAQLIINIDREKANTFGVTFAEINATISANLGSSYINDFPNAGRMQRVTVQADDQKRMTPEDVLNLNVANSKGGMVPLQSFATVEWAKGAAQIVGYNGYPAIRFAGDAAAGYSSGAAIAEMERLAQQLPEGFGYEWSGQSLQEIQSGSQAPFLLGLTVVFIFLLLSALYESWSIPLSVMLVVPLGLIGAVLAVMLRDMPNDVYFKVGLITIIGLSAKNAILIVEFAKDLRAEGKPLLEATIEACKLRFRPILMTSLAFTLGVVPLAIAKGASAASQNAIGTGVMGGMITATVLAIYFVPVFFVFVMKMFSKDDVAENVPGDGGGKAIEKN